MFFQFEFGDQMTRLEKHPAPGSVNLVIQLKGRLCQILTRSNKTSGKRNESVYLTSLGSNKLKL